MKSWKYGILKFFAEFVLIIGSIILSFYIQGKIDDGDAKKEARDIMGQVMTDLCSDTVKYRQEINNGQRLIMVCNYLLNMDYNASLKSESDFDTTSFLIGETITNLYTPVHIAGYTRLVNFGKKEIIKDNPLLDSIIGYYTVSKAKIEGYYEMDRHFVDRTMVERYLSNESYNILNSYYQRKVLELPYDKEIKTYIIDFLENKQIRSLLIFNIINKNNYLTAIAENQQAAIKRIDMINGWLAKKSK
jgi:hypothetical protein